MWTPILIIITPFDEASDKTDMDTGLDGIYNEYVFIPAAYKT